MKLLWLTLVLILGASVFLRAADEINETTSASGIWKWSFIMPDGS